MKGEDEVEKKMEKYFKKFQNYSEILLKFERIGEGEYRIHGRKAVLRVNHGRIYGNFIFFNCSREENG